MTQVKGIWDFSVLFLITSACESAISPNKIFLKTSAQLAKNLYGIVCLSYFYLHLKINNAF